MEEVCGAKVMVSDSDQKFIMMNNQRLYRVHKHVVDHV